MSRILSDTSEKSATLNSHASPMQFPCKSLTNPIFLPFLGRDLKRFTSVPGPLWVRCDTVPSQFPETEAMPIDNWKWKILALASIPVGWVENGKLKMKNWKFYLRKNFFAINLHTHIGTLYNILKHRALQGF